MIVGDAPFDKNKFANEMFDKIQTSTPEIYGVGITNVSEDYIKWKYDEQSKFIVCFRGLPNEALAQDILNLLVAKGIKRLENDPVKKCNNDCKNIFVRNLRGEELSE